MSDNNVANGAIKNFIESKLKRFGEFTYSYMVLNKKNPSQMTIISNYPDEWVSIYRENNYQHIDPVVITALKRLSPFSWDENITINSSINLSKIFSYSKKYNIINGYTFVLHDYNSQLAMLSFMIDQERITEIEDIIEANKEKILMLLVSIHEKYVAYQEEVMQTSDAKHLVDKLIFSKRENEILYWASMGKTYQEIAVMLGVKTTTIKFHIGNVVKKLGVLNAKHAIRLGVELQLIKPVM
ncbi:helix-turn-helix transcriptional regulator [Enterobacillus tribolii]|uniref:LuxR family quorum-sensing system transcriptional regulator ExpR n=1 Tax=Enterobacillus tribolii TaxID=1487935 RepID=A0A370R2G2_9GAMM|nr:LuxR family transcriptional regulator [Enterobacillus tribolii]MBW7983690.1 LuxR family transcriptional regulator [Enterobacillus tribolii]RDK96620.1 LuxR family quorum-sensing system transcriptional regulator ExpR [Enterobacillus tribolii]